MVCWVIDSDYQLVVLIGDEDICDVERELQDLHMLSGQILGRKSTCWKVQCP